MIDVTWKKRFNRGGLILIILGSVGVFLGGGELEPAFETAGQVVTLAGALLVLIREIMG